MLGNMKAYKYIVVLVSVLAGWTVAAPAGDGHKASDPVVWGAESPAVSGEETSETAEDETKTAEDETIPPPALPPRRRSRSTAERTGAIHYAPAMKADTGGTAAADADRPAEAYRDADTGGTATADADRPAEVYRDGAEADGNKRVRFELGLRCLGIWLTDDRKGEPFHGSYIGSIYKLKAKQNWLPIHPYAQVEFALPGGLWLGVGATYSHAETQTLDNGGGDGDVESDLVMGYAVLERPVWRLRPYVEAGGGCAFNSFDATGSWGAGDRRKFVLDNSPVWMAGGGIGLALAEHFTLDAHVRYVHYDVDGTYVFRGDSRPDTDFTFTTSHVAAGAGLSYAF